MASDTVPAAAPGAGDAAEPATPAPARGLLASLFEPVDPARPTFELNPTTGTSDPTTDASLTPGSHVSSATYHGTGDDTDAGGGGTGGSGRQNQSVLRAWLLAGATRWARGGGAANKRLDMLKAKAQARQVKTNRTVTVNSSGGLSPKGAKGPSGNGPSGSGMGQKNNASKNSGGSGRNGSTGASGGGGRGSTGGGGRGASGSGGSGGRSPGSNNSGGGKNSNGTQKNSGTGGTGKAPKNGSGSSGASGSAGASGKGGGTPTRNSHTDSNGKTPRSKNNGTTKTTTCGDASGISLTKDPKPKKDRTKGHDSNTSSRRTGTQTDTSVRPWRKDPAGTGTKDDKANDGKAKKSDTKAAKAGDGDGKGKQVSLKKTPKTQTDTATRTAPADGNGQPINTQGSRETGYRDGTRAGRVVSHVEAYRDGVKDGYTDTRKAAEKEKTRLDKARTDRQIQRAKEQPVPDPTATQPTQAVSSADHQAPQSSAIPPMPVYPPGYHPMPWDTSPQPVEVTSVGRDTIQLGAGAARSDISRGEVRTLKQCERRLEPKADRMTRISDASKAFQAHAEEQAKEVTQLLELAKSAAPGDNLVAEIARLKEAVDAQIGRASEIHKRAVRAADSTRALLVNIEVRYGDMYKAVVNSPLTEPAEMSYYLEGSNA